MSSHRGTGIDLSGPLNTTTNGKYRSWVLLLGFVLLVYLLHQLYEKIRDHRHDVAFGRRYDCKPPPELPTRWPLGIDRIKELWDSNAEGRLLAFVCSVAKDYEPRNNLSQYLLIGPRAYHVLHPKNVEALLSTQFQDYGFGCRPAVFAPLLGNGIFTQEGAAWKHSRELLRKQFIQTQYRNPKQAFGEHVDNLIARIPKYGVIDLQPLFFAFTLDTTTALLFGDSVYSLRADGDQATKNRIFAESFNTAQEGLAKRFRLAPFHFLYSPRAFREACRNVHHFVEEYIKERDRARVEPKEKPSGGDESFMFMDQVGAESASHTHLRDQLLNVLLAGRDTTACCLSWCFRLLVRHPDVFDRLRGEIVSVMGGSGSATREQIRKMPFLSCVIRETLRLYPSVPLNNREAIRTTILPTGGGPDGEDPILVRKGEMVVFSQYINSRKINIYGQDAYDFRPERWETGELNGIGWGYFPFNGGPRQCLGEDFALMEVSYTLIRLVQNFPSIGLPRGEVVEAVDVQQVQQCVRWALGYQVSLTVIGGGHSGHCVRPNVVSVDLGDLNQVEIFAMPNREAGFDSGYLVVAGGGCKTIDIISKTMVEGLTVPLGGHATVGAGLWLQGGIGHLARLHGLSCDAIVGAIVVSVDSAEVLCVGRVPIQHQPAGAIRPRNEADLLWAIKGAGTNFGIVVSVTFKAYPAPIYSVRNWLIPLSDNVEGRLRLGGFDELVATKLPPNCSANAHLYWDGQLHLGVTIVDSYPKVLAYKMPTPMGAILGPEDSLKFVDGVGLFETEVYVSRKHGGKTSSFKRCLFLKHIGSVNIADMLMTAIETRPSPLCHLHLQQGGGAIGDVAAKATAFGSRDWDFACVITGVWPREQDGTESSQATMQWVYSVAENLLPVSGGALGADLGPDPRDAALAAKAFGPNQPHLSRLKRRSDPRNVLAYACPLPKAPAQMLIILVTGESCAGKDYCANIWATVFTAYAKKGIVARVASISDATKQEYAASLVIQKAQTTFAAFPVRLAFTGCCPLTPDPLSTCSRFCIVGSAFSMILRVLPSFGDQSGSGTDWDQNSHLAYGMTFSRVYAAIGRHLPIWLSRGIISQPD